MFDLTMHEIEEYITDDLPYHDITTSLQGCDKKAVLEIYTREQIVISCSEEAKKIAEYFSCKVIRFFPSKTLKKSGDVVICIEGKYQDVHKAWRLMQVLLEYSCKIATYCSDMKKEIDAVNPSCELLTTRKSYPFAKRFCIKSILVGGAMPHRLGLSESVLFFDNHRIVYKSDEDFYQFLRDNKKRLVEKKLVVESSDIKDALRLISCGVDVIQTDKMSIEDIKYLVSKKQNAKIIIAGGVNLKNAREYATTGIDAIVTSAPYLSGMADLGSEMKLIETL